MRLFPPSSSVTKSHAVPDNHLAIVARGRGSESRRAESHILVFANLGRASPRVIGGVLFRGFVSILSLADPSEQAREEG